MTIQHSLITDPNIHEPKGVASATSSYVYTADGAGSGVWSKVLPNGAAAAEAGAVFRSNGAADGSWLRTDGYVEYRDSRVTFGTPSQTLVAAGRTKLLNNGALYSVVRLPQDAGSTSLWDTSTNEINPIAVGDIYSVYLTFIAEGYAGTEPHIDVDYDAGGGTGQIAWDAVYLPKGGSPTRVGSTVLLDTTSDAIANNIDIYLTYDGTGTCTLYSTKLIVVRQSKGYV